MMLIRAYWNFLQVLYNSEDQLVLFKNTANIAREFFGVRKTMYARRIEHLMKMHEAQYEYARNQASWNCKRVMRAVKRLFFGYSV